MQYQDRDSTMTMLLEAGLNVEVEYEMTGIVEGGKITRQSVPVGERLVKGDTITITVEDFVVDWTDASIFEQEVRKSLRKESGEIYASEMLKIDDRISVQPEINTDYSVKPLSNCFNLQELQITGLDHGSNIHLIHTESLENLVQLKSITILGINIEDISWIHLMNKLAFLSLLYTDVRDIDPVINLPSLKNLGIAYTYVENLPIELVNLGLEYLSASEKQIMDIKNPSEWKSPISFFIYDFKGESTQILQKFPLLKSLRLYFYDQVKANVNFDFCTNIKSLESLYLSCGESVPDLSPLSEIKSLKTFGIECYFHNNRWAESKILKDINKMEYLESLDIGISGGKVDFSNLNEIDKLDKLTISSSNDTVFTGLESLEGIKKLEIHYDKFDQRYLLYAKDVEELTFSYVNASEFNPLKDLTHLKVLRFQNCPNVSLEGLAQLTQLEELYINDFSQNKIDELKVLQMSR